MTFTAWIYANGNQDPDGAYIISLNTDGGYVDQALCIAMQGTDLVLEAGGNNKVHYTTGIINQWHHVAVTFNDGELKGYINGEEVLSDNNISLLSRSILTIGARRNSSGCVRFFKGKLNDIRIYNNVLTPQEIKKIAQGLMLHIPLNGTPSSNIQNTKVSHLPSDYQEVEYIENDKDGLAYISLGLDFLNSSYIDEIKMIGTVACSNLTGTRQVFADFGQDDIEFKDNNKLGISSTYLGNTCENGVCYHFKFGVSAEETFFEMNGRGLWMSQAWPSTSSFNSGYLYTQANATNQAKNVRLYHIIIYDGDTKVRDMYPCYKKSNNEAGFYDIVSNTFFTNANTSGTPGLLTCGPLVKPLPSTYISLDYLQSNGTQYFNTGVAYVSTLKVYDTVTFLNVPTGTSSYAISGVDSGGYWGAQGPYWSIGNHSTDTQIILNKQYNVFWDATAKTLYANYVLVDTRSASVSATGNLNLFASSNAGSKQSVKRYNTLMLNNNIPIRDFRPAMRISDSKPGMYDLVNDVFYINSGTGEFAYNSIDIEYDISGFKNDMTVLKNNILLGDRTNNPRYNISANFKDTSNDYMYHHGQFAGNDKIFTISGWVYFTNFTGDNIPFACNIANGGSNALCNIYFHGNNSVIWCVCGSSNVTTPTTWGAATWHMLTITCDGTTAKIYLDGEYTASTTPGSLIQNTNFAIGNRSGISTGESGYSSYFMNGKISDVRMYATCLSANDVAELYNMGRLS